MKKMKTGFKSFIFIAALWLLASCSSKQTTAEPDYKQFSYALAVQYGDYLVETQKHTGAEIDLKEVSKALEDAMKGELKMTVSDANIYINDFYTITIPAYLSYNAKQFIEKAAKKSKNRQTSSGLVYNIVKQGQGNKPDLTDNVTLTYKCTLMDGTIIDGSEDMKDNSTINLSNLVPGFAEGLQLIGEGGEIKMWIPYELAYGIDGNESANVGRYQPLYVEARLIKIN